MIDILKLARESAATHGPSHRYHDLVQACYEQGFEDGFRKALEMAGEAVIETATDRLTADCSTPELLPN